MTCRVNPKKHEFGKTSVCSCGAIFFKDKWHLKSFVDGYRISTVHLQIGHTDNMDLKNDELVYFETMINKKERWLTFQARYKSMSDAIDGHWLTVDNLAKIVLNPDAYPTSILDKFSNYMKAAEDQADVKFRRDNI